MSNGHLNNLIDSNLHTLTKITELLSSLSSERFAKVQRPYFESSLGKHVRHVLDHYLCFKRDLFQGLIDYDKRQRDCQLEKDKEYALSIVQDMLRFFEGLREDFSVDQSVQVLMCNDVATPNGEITCSSLGRELQFLQSHSVHHFALMAAMLRFSGDSVEQDFGVAPSTLVHESAVKASA